MAPMPIQIASKPGVNRDATRFDNDFHVDAQWCRWVGARPQKMGGFRQVTNALPELPRGLHGFYSGGTAFLHTGSESKILRVTSLNGIGGGYVDRTPGIIPISENNTWMFDVRYDPFERNRPMIIAHGTPGLSTIDTTDETPVFWGDAEGTEILTPMAVPPTTASYTVNTLSGARTSGSAIVTSITTAGLSFGMLVTGTGIPAAAYIQSIDSGTQLTLSQNATTTTTDNLVFTVGGVSGGIVALHPYLMHYGADGKVGWSTASNPNDFWGTGSGEAYVTGQKIVKGLPARGGPGNSPSGLLWSLTSLIRVSFIGGDATFGFDEVSTSITVMSPNAIIEADGVFFWVGVDRFFMFNGTVRELPNDMSTDWFFKGINQAWTQKVFAFRNTRWGEIWFCYPRGEATECSHAIVYNMRLQTWYDTELPNGGRSCAISPVIQPYPFMTGVRANEEDSTFTLWQHEIGTDQVQGTQAYAIPSWYETSDITLLTQQQAQNKSLNVTVLEPDFTQTGDMKIQVVGNANARAPSRISEERILSETASTPDEQIITFKETRRQMRFRFESNTAGGHYEAGKILAHIQPADGRMTE